MIRARLFVDGELRSVEGPMEETEAAWEAVIEKHKDLILSGEPHMFEVEFLDEPDIKNRFLRFGSDTRGMRHPIDVSGLLRGDK